MTKLNLTNPIAFFDLETTGVNVASDRIVEISILKINIDGTKEIKTKRINPTIPIPKQSSEIHGIYDADVANEPTFKNVAKSLSEFLNDCDLAGYNSNKFDIPILVEEFLRAEVDFDLIKTETSYPNLNYIIYKERNRVYHYINVIMNIYLGVDFVIEPKFLNKPKFHLDFIFPF